MKDALIPLQDILKEIDFLHSIRERQTFDRFKESSADVRAASYSILVISEAVRRIPEQWLEQHAIRHGMQSKPSATNSGMNTSASANPFSGALSRTIQMP